MRMRSSQATCVLTLMPVPYWIIQCPQLTVSWPLSLTLFTSQVQDARFGFVSHSAVVHCTGACASVQCAAWHCTLQYQTDLHTAHFLHLPIRPHAAHMAAERRRNRSSFFAACGRQKRPEFTKC